MRRAYGGWLDEWPYAQNARGLLIEPFIGQGDDLPIDYKVYVVQNERRTCRSMSIVREATNG